jgi:hypothetical protein
LGILQTVIQQLVESVTDQLKIAVEGYSRKILRQLMKIFVLAGIGVTFLAVGSIFMLIGTTTYLSQFMFDGLAWGIVGLVAALMGIVLLLLITR